MFFLGVKLYNWRKSSTVPERSFKTVLGSGVSSRIGEKNRGGVPRRLRGFSIHLAILRLMDRRG